MIKWVKKHLVFLIAVAIFISVLLLFAVFAQKAIPKKNAEAYRTDFYQAVNADWLEKAVIAKDLNATSEMGNIELLVDKQLMGDINGICAGTIPMPKDIPGFDNFVQYYKLSMDFAARENQGVLPMLEELKQVESLNSVSQFTKMLSEWTLNGMAVPVEYMIYGDLNQADMYTLYLGLPNSILPEVSYYDENNEVGDQLLATYKDSIIKLAVMAGKTQSEAATIAKETLEYDRLLVPFLPTAQEKNDPAKNYSPISYQKLEAINKDLAQAGKKLVGKDVPEVILNYEKFAEGISVALDPDNFQKMKSWMYAKTLMSYKNQLTEEYRQVAGQFEMAKNGLEELTEKEKAASKSTFDFYSEPLGIFYGKTYLGEKGKADVTNMTKEFIATYRKRLEANTWLSSDTRIEAIKKLDKMSMRIGYPDSVDPLFTKLTIVNPNQGGTLVSNTKEIIRKTKEHDFSLYQTKVDKSKFGMSAYTVNAGYFQSLNTICFPAAFLQGAMYNVEQGNSANYGGIGVVIAHEISHAFDPNGSKFDSEGNMKDWWNEKDHQKFEELSQKMVEQFDGIPYGDGTVNGELTLGENVADLGGISCALSVAKSKSDFDAQKFFENYATIWREKRRAKSLNMRLHTDVHAPALMRVNVQLPNFEEFHQTFSVKSGDAMYRAPKDRVVIW